MTRSLILLAAVSAQTQAHVRLFFLEELPFSINVVLRDGSAGCALTFSLLFVVRKVRQMAELVIA